MRTHAITQSKQLAQFDYGPRIEGFGTRQQGDRVVVGIWSKTDGIGSRFAAYILKGGALTQHRVLNDTPAAVTFLEAVR